MKTKNFKFKSMALVLFALVLSSNVWGADGDIHTLIDFSKTGNLGHSSYTDTWTIAANKNSSGNVACAVGYATSNNVAFICFGGKNISNKDTYLGTTTATTYPSKSCKINVLKLTNKNKITINSVKLYVYSDNAYSKQIDCVDITSSYTANTEVTVTPTSGTWPTGSYFKLVINVTNTDTGTNDYTSISYLKLVEGSAAPSCTNKVTVTKNSATGGSYTLKAGSASGAEIADEGTVDNCDANATIVVVPNANSHYHCTGVTASYSASVTGPDGSGNYTITYTKGSSISSTINVTFAEDTKYTISFLDNIQLEEVADIEVYGGATFTFPVLTDKTATTEGTCEQVHYHFMGWVISTHTGEITVGDIKTGTSDAVNANATYKAVWAKEDE